VTELLELLDKVGQTKAAELAASVVDGEAIAFQGVDIITPADVTLVKDLSFRLDKGSSLLLTGHNGSGKSSIFRCLGGLWRIPTGKITRPGGIGDNHAVFYIPQKPYNVLGSLQDQMTYPDVSGAEEISKADLIEVLKEVDLEHLVERKGVLGRREEVKRLAAELAELGDAELEARAKAAGIKPTAVRALRGASGRLDSGGAAKRALVDVVAGAEADKFDYEINWEDELSLGEKQRLAIARLVHHKPRFKNAYGVACFLVQIVALDQTRHLRPFSGAPQATLCYFGRVLLRHQLGDGAPALPDLRGAQDHLHHHRAPPGAAGVPRHHALHRRRQAGLLTLVGQPHGGGEAYAGDGPGRGDGGRGRGVHQGFRGGTLGPVLGHALYRGDAGPEYIRALNQTS
jgi:energy-coupling factor transporter ATP-binding protein EcfA2